MSEDLIVASEFKLLKQQSPAKTNLFANIFTAILHGIQGFLTSCSGYLSPLLINLITGNKERVSTRVFKSQTHNNHCIYRNKLIIERNRRMEHGIYNHRIDGYRSRHIIYAFQSIRSATLELRAANWTTDTETRSKTIENQWKRKQDHFQINLFSQNRRVFWNHSKIQKYLRIFYE